MGILLKVFKIENEHHNQIKMYWTALAQETDLGTRIGKIIDCFSGKKTNVFREYKNRQKTVFHCGNIKKATNAFPKKSLQWEKYSYFCMGWGLMIFGCTKQNQIKINITVYFPEKELISEKFVSGNLKTVLWGKN